ncbi:hypothetical protein BDN72DRAFT_899816, partial [Pluteus cervinus]
KNDSYGSSNNDSYGSSKNDSYGSDNHKASSNTSGSGGGSYGKGNDDDNDNTSSGGTHGASTGHSQGWASKGVSLAAKQAGFDIDDATASKIGDSLQEGLSRFGGGGF